MIKPGLEWYGSFYKDICHLRLKLAKVNSSPDFSLHELHVVIKELKQVNALIQLDWLGKYSNGLQMVCLFLSLTWLTQ